MAFIRSRASATRLRPSGVASISFSKLAANCWSKRCSNFAEERLDLGEDADVLAVAVGEKFQADGAVFDEGGGHLPIADDHAQIGAIFAKNRGVEVRERLGIEITKIPVARFAHGLFAAQIVKIEDESCFFLFDMRESSFVFFFLTLPGRRA